VGLELYLATTVLLNNHNISSCVSEDLHYCDLRNLLDHSLTPTLNQLATN